jgi:uncharacterized membrane protein YgaE (UPF0421/DUF939 family)
VPEPTANDTETIPWKQASFEALFQGLSAACVAVFCYLTARLLPSLRDVYWAPIAAIVVLYPDREATKSAAAQRFLGTAVGSLIGWASAVLWHEHIVLYGVAVFFAVGVCYLLRLGTAARLCAVTVTVITLIPRPEPVYLVAFHRFVEVSYGVTCALVYTIVVGWVRERMRSRRSR